MGKHTIKLKLAPLTPDKGILYLLELHMEDTILIKIGITFRSIESRVLEILSAVHDKYRYYPHCKQLRFKKVDNPLSKEEILHNYFCDYNYRPKHEFSGYTELFAVDRNVAKEAYDKLLDGILEDDRYYNDMGFTDNPVANQGPDR
jgi:hypothetical protein